MHGLFFIISLPLILSIPFGYFFHESPTGTHSNRFEAMCIVRTFMHFLHSNKCSKFEAHFLYDLYEWWSFRHFCYWSKERKRSAKYNKSKWNKQTRWSDLKWKPRASCRTDDKAETLWLTFRLISFHFLLATKE